MYEVIFVDKNKACGNVLNFADHARPIVCIMIGMYDSYL